MIGKPLYSLVVLVTFLVTVMPKHSQCEELSSGLCLDGCCSYEGFVSRHYVFRSVVESSDRVLQGEVHFCDVGYMDSCVFIATEMGLDDSWSKWALYRMESLCIDHESQELQACLYDTCRYVGTIYARGSVNYNMSPDEEKSISLFGFSCSNGSAPGCMKLVRGLYFYGNHAKALSLSEKFCLDGYADVCGFYERIK